MEAALCLTYYLIFILRESIGNALKSSGLDVDVEQFFVWFVPQFILCYFLHQFKNRHKLLGVLYYLCWFAWIPLLLLCSDPDSWSVGIAYLLAGVALVIGTEKMDNVSFGRNILSVVLKLAESMAVGLVLWLVILVIAASTQFLFDLTLPEEYMAYPSVFIGIVITPLLCCSLLDKSSEPGKGENFLRIMVDVILSTALVLYAAILYVYIIRVLLNWELPKGGVAYTVLGFLCVAMACYLLRLQVEKRHYEWFYKAFPSLAIPPLVLLWIGVFRRVGEYGLTEPRVYLLVVSALMTLFVGMLFSEQSRRFQLMALILAASAILFTYVPGIRAQDISRRSQQARSEKPLPEVQEDIDDRVLEMPGEYNVPILGIRMDDSFDFGEGYRYIREAPQVIVDEQNNIVVEGFMLSYGFDEDYIITLMQDHETRDSVYWIINKRNQERKDYYDADLFQGALDEHGIKLSLIEFPRYYKNLERERWQAPPHRR